MKHAVIHDTTVLQSKAPSRNNNFSAVRFIGTMFVFAGHMGIILGIQPPLFGGFGLHELGVMILFLISGYLITQSWLSDPNPLRYGIRRFFRLWPPFAVFVLIMVFVAGPLVSSLGIREYFQSEFQAYLRNLRFFISYSQPGVFSDLPVPNTTNGSLWTMPVEASLYIVTPLLLAALRVKYRSVWSFRCMGIITGTAVLFDLFLRMFFFDKTIVIYGTELISSYHLIVMYIIGIFFTYDEVKKYLNLQLGCLAMCFLLFCQVLNGAVQHLLLYLIFPYFIFSFVFAKKPLFGDFCHKVDLSYGIYLYGFFFQQLTVSWMLKSGMSLGYIKTFLLSLAPTVLSALLSFFLVEKPVLILSKSLIRKLKQTKSEPRT